MREEIVYVAFFFQGEDSCCMRRVVKENHRLQEVQEGGDDGAAAKRSSVISVQRIKASVGYRGKASLQLYVAQVVRTPNKEELHYVQYLDEFVLIYTHRTSKVRKNRQIPL